MALIKCPNCKVNVSDRAKQCPKCGCFIKNIPSISNNSHSKKLSFLISIVAIIVVIAILVALLMLDDKKKMDTYISQGYYKYYSIPRTGTAGALYQAESYLNYSAYSYTGLIEQLEYIGFSNYEATYAAENCGADWNEQAIKKAKSYLKSSAFSYTGLIDQLEFEGFTSSQSKYGTDNCGADWYEQAVKEAKSYLKLSDDWTKSQLIDQLEFGGFTYSEAVYGANNCGKEW